MYSFEDRGGEQITLRPEGTGPIARAFISNGMAQNTPVKWFYHGPMFRYERPQKGRQRQFHQVGVELIGVEKTLADLEILSLAHLFLQDLGLRERCTLEINSIGDSESRSRFRESLVQYLSSCKDKLSQDSQKRLQHNPLRILDSKDAGDQEILKEAPRLHDHLNPSSREFFEDVCDQLDRLNINYTKNEKLVRGLDYYQHCVFEFTTNELGAQNALLAGGRYDGLIEQMGGGPTPAVGWACGIERLSLMLGQNLSQRPPITLIPMGDDAEQACIVLMQDLRNQGLKVEMAFSGNLNKRIKKANKVGSQWAILLGSEELAKGKVTVKNLDKNTQQEINMEQLAAFFNSSQ
jgi:histidyl-tRNA synthetase